MRPLFSMKFPALNKGLRLLILGATGVFSSGCLTNYMWHSRLADGGVHPSGAQKFEGTLNRSWFHDDRRILLEGELREVGEDGCERRVPGFLMVDTRDASTLRYRFVKGSITLGLHHHDGERVQVDMERFASLSVRQRPAYKLTTPPGDFDKAPEFIAAGEINPAAQGFRRLAFHDSDKVYAFVVAFDERGYPTLTEVLDKSGKVVLTLFTVGTDLTVFAVAVPFVVCVGLPYALLDSCAHPSPPDCIPSEPAGVCIAQDGRILGETPKPFVTADAQALLDATEPRDSPYVSGARVK